MPKQLSLSFQNEWWMQVIEAISDEKKEKAISEIKELFIAYLKMRAAKEEENGQRDNQRVPSIQDGLCIYKAVHSISNRT